MSRKYYAAENRYGSASSVGFANAWYVAVFDSQSSRDDWVESRGTLTARAIKRDEVIEYAASNSRRPEPFTGEYWGIRPSDEADFVEVPEGLVGFVEVVDPYRFGALFPRFYK